MTQFQAGKTYPLRGGGEGEIFVTKDGKHWGRKTDLDGYWTEPTVWHEDGRECSGYGCDLLTPPTTVTRWVRIYEDGDISSDLFDTQAQALCSVCNNVKAIPIHITTHADGRIEIKGGSE